MLINYEIPFPFSSTRSSLCTLHCCGRIFYLCRYLWYSPVTPKEYDCMSFQRYWFQFNYNLVILFSLDFSLPVVHIGKFECAGWTKCSTYLVAEGYSCTFSFCPITKVEQTLILEGYCDWACYKLDEFEQQCLDLTSC